MKWMQKASVAVAITVAVSLVTGSQFALAKTTLPRSVNMNNIAELSAIMTPQGGKLLLSDSPEMVPGDGIMYQDTVSGDVRLFFHHVNATKEPKKIIVLLANDSAESVDVFVQQYGLAGPSTDYLAVGKVAQLNYLNQSETELIAVPGNGTALLEPILNDTVIATDALVNGMYDFRADRPVKVMVMMMPVDADPAKFATTAEVLPTDSQRLRGTFPNRDRLLMLSEAYNPAENGVMGITLADHHLDRFVSGVDATDGSSTINYGNYGILYKLFIPTTFDQNYSVYLNPRGGEFAGGFKVKYRHLEESTVATPDDRLFFGSKTVKDITHIGDFSGGQSLWLTFSPPGASNLPVKIILAPVAKPK